MPNLISLLGQRWIASRLRLMAQQTHRKNDTVQYVLDPLEPRVLFSVNPGLPTPDSSTIDPDVATVIYEVDQQVPLLTHPDSRDRTVSAQETPSPTNGTTDPGGAPALQQGTGQVPFGATYRDNSEFLLGDVAVSIVLFESDGSLAGADTETEDWTQAEKNNVRNEIISGLSWWENTLDLQNTQHDLNFFYDWTYLDNPVQTKYEPINRNSTDESLWVNDFLQEVGETSHGSYKRNVDEWNHAQRQAMNTDWSYTIFVVDSSADPDGKFADSWFAYAWIGGPFTMMTYDNNGWGISRMNNVVAHESAHLFYALDEYPGGSSYNSRSGYYDTQNLNAADGNPNPGSRVASIMSDGNSQLSAWNQNTSSPSSLEMMGWRDSDGNGIFDVLDVPLSLSGTGSIDQDTGIYSFDGFSSVNTLTNQNPFGLGNDITINTVDMIQYRIDGGQWIDGNLYGDHTANVTQNVQFTSGGHYTIDFRTIVSQTGLTSNIISDTFSFTNSLPGITISALPDLTTTEAGGTATFDVVLNSQPTDDVTITVASDDTSEGTVSPASASLTFTPDNWETPQSVTVIGADDALDDGNVNYNILLGPATSNDTDYNGLAISPVAVTNTDDDTIGITISALPDLTTTEAGGTATFDVVLNSQPTDDVTITVASDNTSEGTVSPATASLIFTPDNWETPQAVNITGADDALDDGDVNYNILLGPAVSNDADYNGLAISPVAVTNTDDDDIPTGVSVDFNEFTIESYDGANQDFDPVTTIEDNGDTLNLVGNGWKKIALPYTVTADTVIEFDFTSSAQGEIHGIGFDTDNVLDSDRTFKLYGTQNWGVLDFNNYATSAPDTVHYVIPVGQFYTGQMNFLTFTNDHDTALPNAHSRFTNINIHEGTPPAPTPAIDISALPGLTTTEASGTATFEVVLNSQPTDDVTITVASDDPSEGTVLPASASLTFTPDNWETPQSVTVIGADDTLADGDVNYNINLGPAVSNDADYNGLAISPVSVTNTDDDAPPTPVEVIVDNQDSSGFTTSGTWLESSAVDEYSGSSLYSFDAGDTATWTPTLPEAGTYEVYVWWSRQTATGFFDRDSQARYDITHDGTTDSYVIDQDSTSGQWVLLDTLNFNAAGSETVTLTSSGTGPNGTSTDAVRFVKVADPDPTPNITISALPGLTTTEAGGTATFDVVLDSQPTDDVTITIISDDTSEGTVSPASASLTFTPDNWDTPQSVTVIGADDTLDDGDINYNILLGPAVSNDTDYNGLAISPVAVTNTDDDDAPPIPVEVIVDNQDSSGFTTSGTWLESSAADEYSGSSLYSFGAGDTATWTPALPEAGTYEVYVRWSRQKSNGSFFDRDSQALYSVTHGGTTDSYVIDQDSTSGQWVLLDTLSFTGDGSEFVTLTSSGTGPNGTSADAVRFVKV